MVFFWACEVTETKAAVVKIPENFVLNVCQATLASASNEGVLSLGLETTQMDSKVWKGVVAHLGAAAHAHQVKLDLVIGSAGSQIKFYVAKGTGKVNLTGYFQPGPPSDFFDEPVVVAANEEPAAPAVVETSQKKNKKRAREEKKAATTWDQAASDSDSDNEKETKPEPVAKQAKKEEAKKEEAKKEEKPQTPAPAQANGTSEGAKKKRKNKNKNKNKEKKDN